MKWAALLALLAALVAAPAADGRLSLRRAHKAAVNDERAFWGARLYHEYITDRGCSRTGPSTASCHFSLEGEGTSPRMHVSATFLFEVVVSQHGRRLHVWKRYGV